MKKILATIDFDGVVSPINHEYDFSNDSSFAEYRLGGFNCFVKHETVEFLNWLSEQEHVEAVWASSWEEMTQLFHQDTDGAFPHLRALSIPDSKAESILDEAVRLGVEEVHIFEDHSRVLSQAKTAVKKNPELFPFKVVTHKCETAVGLTEKQLLSARTLLS